MKKTKKRTTSPTLLRDVFFLSLSLKQTKKGRIGGMLPDSQVARVCKALEGFIWNPSVRRVLWQATKNAFAELGEDVAVGVAPETCAETAVTSRLCLTGALGFTVAAVGVECFQTLYRVVRRQVKESSIFFCFYPRAKTKKKIKKMKNCIRKNARL